MSVSAQTVAKALLERDLVYVVETVSEVHPAFVEKGRREALGARAASLLRTLPDEVPRWRLGVMAWRRNFCACWTTVTPKPT